tara:strand:- start:136 stop:393 length:258 start_codon:yes stop_codon:yes gene_type:complete
MSLIVLKDADKAFTALYSNWFANEKTWYSINFCNIDDDYEDCDPDDIPIEKLKDCDYKNLRILDEFFSNWISSYRVAKLNSKKKG